MAEIIAIAGESGSGKSTSIRHLDSKETYLINTSGKSLPFKGSNKLYNIENKNYYEPEGILETLSKLKKISEKALHIKQIIIDDSNYLQTFNMMEKSSEIGYTKFTLLCRDVVSLIQGAKKLRENLVIYYITHTEPVFDGEDVVNYKIKTIGKMLDNQVILEGLFTTILYSHIEVKGDETKYYFITKKFKKYLSKSPDGMFEDLKIPNDLKLVTDTIREYYK